MAVSCERQMNTSVLAATDSHTRAELVPVTFDPALRLVDADLLRGAARAQLACNGAARCRGSQ